MSKLQVIKQDGDISAPAVVAMKRGINSIMNGRINSIGTVTLRASQTTTTLYDNNISPSCVILFSAQTADAAAVSASLWYDLTSIPQLPTKVGGQITLHHSSTANTDQTFGYVIFV